PAMRAFRLRASRDLAIAKIAEPPPPAADEARLRVLAVALNNIDVWGYRGAPFAKRQLPITIGAEAVAEIEALGAPHPSFHVGQRVALFSQRTCGTCRACREGRDNLCEAIEGVYGIHFDGFAQDRINHPVRLLIPVPTSVTIEDAACAPVAYA